MAKKSEGTTLIEKWAIWLIGICIVLLLCGVGCFVVNKTLLAPKVVKLEIRIVPDSLTSVDTYTKVEVDSLISVTKKALESYRQYFQTTTVQQETEDTYKSFGALLLSVVVGLCGFFGFKSFKDIKDKGEETARDIAAKEAKDVAEKKAEKAAEKYLESKLPGIVEKQFEKSFNATTIAAIRESVKADVIPQIVQQLQGTAANGDGEQQEGQEPTVVNPMSPNEMFNQQPENE